MGWSLLPAVSDAAQCSVGCVADVEGGARGSLGEVGGLWRCDAAGAAQCGSGEAALCFLPRSRSPSPSFSSLLISPPPFFLLPSPPSAQPCRFTRPVSLSSPSLSCFYFSPALLLSSFVASAGSTLCQAARLSVCFCTEVFSLTLS